MKVTPNYILPQIEGNDFFDKEVLNDGFRKIDVAIGDLQETINNASGDAGVTTQEVVEARKGEADLKTRINKIDELAKVNSSQLEQTTQQITNIEVLKALTLQVGTIINVAIDEVIKGKYEITSSGMANDYSVIKLNNNRYATRIYDTYNEWAKALGKGSLIAHKGFNGYNNGTTVSGIYPENSSIAFEKAGEFGFKAIETDVLVTSDGKWVVSHELDTKYLSGTLANISSITFDDFKSRTFTKQYIGNNQYWQMSGENLNMNPPTMEEMLMICKKYNMYAIVELKWAEPYYIEDNFIEFANVVKNCGMEEKVIVYGSRPSVMDVMKYLPNAIAGFTDITSDDYIKLIKSYQNHMLSVSETKYNTLKDTIKTNKIPCAIWTIDDYKKTEGLFKNGVDYVLTNVILKEPNLKGLTKRFIYDTNYVNEVITTTGSGTTTFDTDTKSITFNATTYYAKSLTIQASKLKKGDVIRVKATAKTVNSTTGNVARIYITNNNSTALRQSYVYFENRSFETKEVYYVVNDVSENLLVWIGHSGGGFSGASSSVFKDITIEHFSQESFRETLGNERYCYIYSSTDNFAIRNGYVNKGIKSVTINGAILEVEYEPFAISNGYPLVIATPVYYSTNYNRKILPDIMNTDTTNNKVKIRFAEPDGTMITNISGAMGMGFVLQIRN